MSKTKNSVWERIENGEDITLDEERTDNGN